MESESTEPQCCPSILRPDYSPSESPIATALYSQRFSNDNLMGEILELAIKNKDLNARINELKQSTPSFLSNWWESSVGAAEIPTMISKVEKALVEQMEVMNAAIKQFKAQKETEGLEVEKELEQEQQLQKTKADLESTLARMTQANNRAEEELNCILFDRKNFSNTIKQLQEHKNMLQLERSIQLIQINKIRAASPQDSEAEAERKYFEQMKSLLNYLVERRRQLEVAADQASGELAKTNNQIEQYEQETRVNQVRKENIVSQHVELKRLREELAQQEERRREAEQKRAELERAYCEEEMEKVTGDYQNLQRRLDNLVGKTLSLARVSIDRAKLQPLERAIIQEPQL